VAISLFAIPSTFFHSDNNPHWVACSLWCHIDRAYVRPVRREAEKICDEVHQAWARANPIDPNCSGFGVETAVRKGDNGHTTRAQNAVAFTKHSTWVYHVVYRGRVCDKIKRLGAKREHWIDVEVLRDRVNIRHALVDSANENKKMENSASTKKTVVSNPLEDTDHRKHANDTDPLQDRYVPECASRSHPDLHLTLPH
jgi:hypothetical protein